jgi:ProQ/FINO family
LPPSHTRPPRSTAGKSSAGCLKTGPQYSCAEGRSRRVPRPRLWAGRASSRDDAADRGRGPEATPWPPGGFAEANSGDGTARSLGGGAARVLCGLSRSGRAGMTSPQIEQERGRKEAGQQLGVLRERWPLAFPVQAQDVRPLAMGVANQIAETMGWSLSYSVGVLTIWKMSTTYCRAVLNRDQRITLDGTPVEEGHAASGGCAED